MRRELASTWRNVSVSVQGRESGMLGHKHFALVLLLAVSSFAGDTKALLTGIGIGAGLAVTKKYTVVPAAKATKKAVKKTAHVSKKVAHVLVGK